jgi:peptide/nickel transport system substrate-binding protein
MSKQRKAVVAACLFTAAATVLTACGSSGGGGGGNTSSGAPSTSSSGGGSGSSSTTTTAAYNAAQNALVKPSTKTGGTLQLLSSADCDSWDPQRTYYGWCWNMQRLFTRTLVGYSGVNGLKYKLAPDLATNLGKHNKDFSTWTFTLKKGLKFSTGKAITPMDVKYGIERLFAQNVINGGPASYFLDNIKHPKNYKGPYQSGDLPSSSIKTTKSTITFHLTGPYADWPYIMAIPAAAPVPYKVEGGKYKGATYTKGPVASGPFKIQSYTQNKSITFVRNPDWSQSTDTIRHPLVTSIDLTIDKNPVDIDNKLQNGQADGNASTCVGIQFQSKILTNPQLKANADDPISAQDRYLAVMQSVIPNVHCRRAIFYAFDKAGVQRVYGGSTAGALAGSMTPPGIQGYEPSYNPYPSGSNGSGDVAKAKQELQKCGKPGGFPLKFAYATPSTTAPNVFKTTQQALGRVGIKVSAVTQDSSTYYSTFIGSPKNIKNQGIGIALAGWGADFPTGYGFYNAIANGNAIYPTGKSNYPSLNDPVVNKVLNQSTSGKSTTQDWVNLDHAIMNDAVYLPVLFSKTLYYHSSRLTNYTCNNAQAFGIYDWVNVGVTS